MPYSPVDMALDSFNSNSAINATGLRTTSTKRNGTTTVARQKPDGVTMRQKDSLWESLGTDEKLVRPDIEARISCTT